MTYFSIDLVRRAISELGAIHPFYGITFLVCKKSKLPVGRAREFGGINKAETTFMNQFYKPDPRSAWYFQPLHTSKPDRWLSPKYASSGSQKTRTAGQLAAAFIHPIDSDLWGWQQNYVQVLQRKLARDRVDRIPILWLAVWLLRHKQWPMGTTAKQIIKSFINEFSINDEESESLFSTATPDVLEPLVDEPYSDENLLPFIGRPPDAAPDEGGTLQHLRLNALGPSDQLEFNPGERLSVITGDNGLGKTFLLDCAWWSLTGEWVEPGRPAYPRTRAGKGEPAITFVITGAKGGAQNLTVKFDFATQTWPAPKNRPIIPGLTLYARVDGSFAIFDPVRHGGGWSGGSRAALVFTRNELMDGLPGRIEGLLRDWVKWQHSPDQSIFETFKAVLRRLSPPDMNPLEPGPPIRMPNDAREIPTLQHSYDVVPLINESAGVKRIVALAYLLVWAWNEHKISSSLARKAPQERMVILIDEMEAHLHPKWQRVVLPAILDVIRILNKELEAQLIILTHSPLILASLEHDFADPQDKLFHFQLQNAGVSFSEVPFIRHGRVDAWLTSDLFELRQATSQETENALERAKRLISQDTPDPAEIREVSVLLSQSLPAEDLFWPRWLHFAQQKGVKL